MVRAGESRQLTTTFMSGRAPTALSDIKGNRKGCCRRRCNSVSHFWTSIWLDTVTHVHTHAPDRADTTDAGRPTAHWPPNVGTPPPSWDMPVIQICASMSAYGKTCCPDGDARSLLPRYWLSYGEWVIIKWRLNLAWCQYVCVCVCTVCGQEHADPDAGKSAKLCDSKSIKAKIWSSLNQVNRKTALGVLTSGLLILFPVFIVALNAVFPLNLCCFDHD